jgi:small subunit ribosomal protein S20
MRQAVRRAARNRSAKSAVRTYVKKAAAAVAGGSDDAAEVVRQAVRALDKAAQKGIVHPNAAARRKSRLMGRLHQLSLVASEAPAVAETKSKAKAPAKRTTAKSGAKAPARRPATPRKPAARS